MDHEFSIETTRAHRLQTAVTQLVSLISTETSARELGASADVTKIIDVHDMLVELKRAISPLPSLETEEALLTPDIEAILASEEGVQALRLVGQLLNGFIEGVIDKHNDVIVLQETLQRLDLILQEYLSIIINLIGVTSIDYGKQVLQGSKLNIHHHLTFLAKFVITLRKVILPPLVAQVTALDRATCDSLLKLILWAFKNLVAKNADA